MKTKWKIDHSPTREFDPVIKDQDDNEVAVLLSGDKNSPFTEAEALTHAHMISHSKDMYAIIHKIASGNSLMMSGSEYAKLQEIVRSVNQRP